jgi:succinate dehydrogenase / fumarate reductase cytochrome b subunit
MYFTSKDCYNFYVPFLKEVKMSSLKTTLTGYARYRGREGHWSFLLHRITGLGTILFLALHIVDIALVYFSPKAFLDLIGLYQTTLFGIGEIILVFCVLYHGINGIRIAYFDLFKPHMWEKVKERYSSRVTISLAVIIWIPAAFFMIRSMLINNFHLFG